MGRSQPKKGKKKERGGGTANNKEEKTWGTAHCRKRGLGATWPYEEGGGGKNQVPFHENLPQAQPQEDGNGKGGWKGQVYALYWLER